MSETNQGRKTQAAGLSSGVYSDLLLLDFDAQPGPASSPGAADTVPRTLRLQSNHGLPLDIDREKSLLDFDEIPRSDYVVTRGRDVGTSAAQDSPQALWNQGTQTDQDVLLPEIAPQPTYSTYESDFQNVNQDRDDEGSRENPPAQKPPVPNPRETVETAYLELQSTLVTASSIHPPTSSIMTGMGNRGLERVGIDSPLPQQVPCAFCEHEEDRVVYYCNSCDEYYCDNCWMEQQPLHRRKDKGRGKGRDKPHEKTDQLIAKKIEDSLEPEKTELEQDQLHQLDENTAWFGVVRDIGDERIFEDYGRFAVLMSESCLGNVLNNRNRYPGLVSFVGETGAGKSTLIKVLIELHYRGAQVFHTPVVGSIKCHQSNPTTGDVHLYIDPHTCYSEQPILYADCEGINGGERTPMGSKSHKKDLKERIIGKPRKTGSFHKKIRKLHQSSKREITWATSSETKSREFTVLNLYPRLLYTFSDAIVFVHKNPKTLEDVVEKLLMWASKCLEKSSNQPILPHAIIALNAMSNSIKEELWDVEGATRDFLDSVGKDFHYNVKFTSYIRFWKEHGQRFETLKDLILSYYANITVVYIPGKGRPNLISDQVEKLYHGISTAVAKSRETKRTMRMLLNAVDIQPYLQSAFDHFASHLDLPFDFVQASFANNPIHLDFGGHILKLAIRMVEVLQNKNHEDKKRYTIDGERLFGRLGRMVASCIMLDSAGNRIGGPEVIFRQYVDHLDDALEDFCDKYWPCEFVNSKGVKCNNVKSGHSKGHQSKTAKVIGVGEYKSSFSYDSYRDQFCQDVYNHFCDLLKQLGENTEGSNQELSEAFRIHSESTLPNFYKSAGGATQFISHSACFSCLVDPPQYQLPCGHVFCSRCILGYGTHKNRHCVELRGCPLHMEETEWWKPYIVYLKPDGAGIRLLTLDGGGVRGIVELEILRQIEMALGGQMSINLFFDFIVGTSTGGIIALGLGAKGWTVSQCTEKFKDLCRKAFTRRKGTEIPGLRYIIKAHYHSEYETGPLQNALMEAFDEEYLFGGSQMDGWPRRSTKVAVTSVLYAGSKQAVLANYNRSGGINETPYQFQRPERLDHELKIWEAARATSAAPGFFKPFPHAASKHEYMDGGLYNNNPINIADSERKLLWPELGHVHPDIVLSVGSGYNPQKDIPLEPVRSPKPRVGAVSMLKSLYHICVDHIHSSLNSEQTWKNYLEHISPRERDAHRFQRLNVPLTGPEDPPQLDDVEALARLERLTREEMFKNNSKVQLIADHLVATTFYFEKHRCDFARSDDGYVYHGAIQCRIPQKDVAMEQLGNFLRSLRFNREVDIQWCPYFIVEERGFEQAAEQVTISDETIDNMIHRREFLMGSVPIKLSTENAITKISLCLAGGRDFPISGFPRELLREDKQMHNSQRPERQNPKRWRSRGESNRAGGWKSPSLTKGQLGSNHSIPGVEANLDASIELGRVGSAPPLETINHAEFTPSELSGEPATPASRRSNYYETEAVNL